MRRMTASRSLGLVLACSAAAIARDDGPPLTAPADLPPTEAMPDHRPVLVVPGLTPPRSVPARTPLPVFEPAVPAGDLPPLVGPADMLAPESVVPPRSAVGSSSSREPRALSLETVPEETLNPYPDSKPRPRPTPRPEPPAPSRRFRLFGGRVLPPPLLGGRGAARPGPEDVPITVEPRSDPAADAALKRRLERQIREAAGNKIRSLDVRVLDRTVHIVAEPAHFWQRRALRCTLESLPALDGYRTTIDVDD